MGGRGFFTERDGTDFSVGLESNNEITALNLINRAPLKLTGEDRIIDALDIFVGNNTDVILVGNGRGCQGLLSKRTILNACYEDSSFLDVPLSKILDSSLVFVDSKSTLSQLCQEMVRKNSLCFLLGNSSKVIGSIGILELFMGFKKFYLQIENTPLIGSVMSKNICRVDQTATLAEVISLLQKTACDYVLIMDGDHLAGIISSKDIMSILRKEYTWSTLPCTTSMSVHVVSLTPGQTINEALSLMLDRRFNQIPIVEGGKVTGILTLEGLLGAYVEFMNDLTTRIQGKNVAEIVRVSWKNESFSR